jgi:hypothetical protein
MTKKTTDDQSAVAEALAAARQRETATARALGAAERAHGATALALARATDRQHELAEKLSEAKAAATAAHVAVATGGPADTEAGDATLRHATTALASVSGALKAISNTLKTEAEALHQARVDHRLAEIRRLSLERFQAFEEMWPRISALGAGLRRAAEMEQQLRRLGDTRAGSFFATWSPVDFGKTGIERAFNGKDVSAELAQSLRMALDPEDRDIRKSVDARLREEAQPMPAAAE